MQQIELAKELKRPFIIHGVRAWGQLLDILHEKAPLEHGFMIHAYSGSAELIQPLTKLGGYISYAGSITNNKNSRLQKAVESTPTDRLLIETDAPDFLPYTITNQKQPNEPKYLLHIAKAIATIRNQTVDQISVQTSKNAQILFQLPHLQLQNML